MSESEPKPESLWWEPLGRFPGNDEAPFLIRCRDCWTVYAVDNADTGIDFCSSYDCAECDRRVIANEVQL